MVTSQLPLWSDKDAAQGWVVRESNRARRLTVRVFHTGRVEVVVPSRTSALTVERFVERHRTWIERKREEARARAVPVVPFPPTQIDLAACGEAWRVHLSGVGKRVRLQPIGNGLLAIDGDTSDARAVRQVFRRWLTERAADVLGVGEGAVNGLGWHASSCKPRGAERIGRKKSETGHKIRGSASQEA